MKNRALLRLMWWTSTYYLKLLYTAVQKINID